MIRDSRRGRLLGHKHRGSLWGGGVLHDPGVRHDGLGQAGDDVAGVGVGQDLGLRHEAGDIHVTGATNTIV